MNRREIFPRSLQYLIAIAEHGSFTRAAEALHVSQPSLSQQIKLLEESLKTTLLDRSGRVVRLTHAGEIYLGHVRRAWNELDNGSRAIGEIDDLSRGLLRLGWTPITDQLTCCLLDRFHRLYPGISLQTLEMPQDEIGTALTEGLIDIGIAFTNPKLHRVEVEGIQATTLFEEGLGVVVSDRHPRAGQQTQMSAEEFEKESLVLLNPTFTMRQVIDRYCYERAIEPVITIETNSLNVVIEMVRLGQHASVLPTSIAGNHCGLHLLELNPAIPLKAVTMMIRSSGYNDVACAAFRDVAKEWARSRPQNLAVSWRAHCHLREA